MINQKDSKKIIILINYIVIIILLILLLLSDKKIYNSMIIKSSIIIISINLLFSYVVVYKEKPYLSISFVYLSIFILYSMSQILMASIGLKEFSQLYSKEYYKDYSVYYQLRCINVLGIAYSSLVIGILCSFKKKFLKKKRNIFNIRRNVKILLVIGSIPYLLDRINKILLVVFYSRLDYFKGKSIFPKFLYDSPYLIIIFKIGFFGYILFCNSKRNKKRLIFIYVFISMIVLLFGFRGAGAKDILELIIVLSIEKRKKIKIKYLFIISIFAPIIFQVSFLLRNNIEITKLGLKSSFVDFLFSQGKSSDILFYSMLFRKKIGNINPLLASFSGVFNRIRYYMEGKTIPRFQSIDQLNYTESLGLHVTYTAFPQEYMSGRSLGNFAVAEVYFTGGIFLVILLYFLLGYILSYIEIRSEKDFIYLILIGTISQYVLLQPRSAFLPSIVEILFILMIIFLVIKIKIKN